ncbi:MAG: ABC transporter ATP-binding protein [Planctomycetaceae bacterium]
MSCLEVVELRKSYGSARVVNGVSFTVEAGEIFGLLGPNGAGKTTTMSMIAGLLEADSGDVRFDGRPLKSLPRDARRFLGIAPQDLAIYPELSARENLEFFGKLYGLHGTALKQRCNEVLDQIGLTEHAGRHSGHFSGGMKRRLNFGVALLHRPKLLILDEPTVGVDPQSRSHLLDCIRHEASQGMAVIYASHYMEEVSAICDRVAIMDHGVRMAMGRLDELLGQMQQELALRVRGLSAKAREELSGLLESNGDITGESRLVLHRSADATNGLIGELRRVLDVLDREKSELISVETNQSNLERLFLKLTGHSLRD